MVNAANSTQLARDAEQIYEQRLKQSLDATHRGQFVAIGPESGNHYLGRTLSEAIGAARKAHPNRLAYVLRVGEEPAIQIGGCEP